jgi:aldehyde dehydrogenase family 7 protein A1
MLKHLNICSNAMFQVYDAVLAGLKKSYEQVMKRIGDPIDDGILYGPMHSEIGVQQFKTAVAEAVKQGGKIEFGGKVRGLGSV